MPDIVLGLIPARGGSKAIIGKNLTPLAGRPLLAYTTSAALQATRLDRIIVSTDDAAIAKEAIALGVEAPFLRPADLSGDTTPMLPVIQHAVDWCEKDGTPVGMVVLLQPTSPLRCAEHIDEALALADAENAETVVSVVSVPHNFSPDSVMVEQDGQLLPFLDGPMVLRRQEKSRYVARNGPAILAVRGSAIRRGTLYGNPTVGYEMTAATSIDIDEPEDLWLAQQYLTRKNGIAT